MEPNGKLLDRHTIDAQSVLVLVCDYSIFSRSERISWFFKHLLAATSCSESDEGDDNILVLSAQSSDGAVYDLSTPRGRFQSFVKLPQDSKHNPPRVAPAPVLITPRTQSIILPRKYRLVFSLDVSPSMAAIDPVTGEVLFDQAYTALEKCLTALVEPSSFKLTGFPYQFLPQIYVSVVAQGSVQETFKSLVQGVLLTSNNVGDILVRLKHQIRDFENEVASIYNASVSDGLRKRSLADLSNTIHNSVFALKLLPPDACPGLVLITDGVCAVPDLSPYDNMLMLLNREDITCSTVQVGSGTHPHCVYGYTPDIEVLRHLSASTSGQYFELGSLSGVSVQQALLVKTFSASGNFAQGGCDGNASLSSHGGMGGGVGGEGDIIVSDLGALHAVMAVDYPYPWVGPPPPIVLLQTQVKDYPLDCDIMRLIDVRIREGFGIASTDSMEHASTLVVKLLLAWLPNVKIEYIIQAVNKKADDGGVLKISLNVLAYYEFLHQFTSVQKQKGVGGAAPSVAKLQVFLTHVQETDRLLSHLYTQCQSSVANPNGSRAFWKIMGSLGNNAWHRWLKTEKLGLLLCPVVVASRKSGIYRPTAPSDFIYDHAKSLLIQYCIQWATFNQSKQLFVKFLAHSHRTQNSPPFCVMRLLFEAPGFVVIQLAFFSASPSDRALVISSLKFELERLTLDESPNTNNSNDRRGMCPLIPLTRSLRTLLVKYDPAPVADGSSNNTSFSRDEKPIPSSLPRTLSTISSVTPTLSAIPVPRTRPTSSGGNLQSPPTSAANSGYGYMNTIGVGPEYQSPPISNSNINSNNITQMSHPRLVFLQGPVPPLIPSFSFLQWYMWHKRWVWTLRDTRTCEMVLGIILESRMREGFVPISTGIYTFFKEIMLLASGHETSEEPQHVPSAIQYLTFLSHPNTIVLELWMEPQCGTHITNNLEDNEAPTNGTDSVVTFTERQVFDELISWLSESDTHVISALTTFNHLGNANQTRKIFLPPHTLQCENSHTPPLSLDSLTLFGECVNEKYPMLSVSSAGGDFAGAALLANKRLYDMLASAIHRASSYEVTVPDDSRFKGGRFFVKVCVPARLVLVFLHPVAEREENFVLSFYDITLESFGPTPFMASFKSIGPLFRHPVVSVTHTSPSYEDDEDEDEFDSDNELIGNKSHNSRGSPPNHTLALSQYIEAAREGYNISLAHAVFASIREDIGISTVDTKRAMSTLHEYNLDVDITQFLQVLQQRTSYPQGVVETHFAQQLAYNFSVLPQCDNYYYYRQQLPLEDTLTCEEVFAVEENGDSGGFEQDTSSADEDVPVDDSLNHQEQSTILFMRMEAVLIQGTVNEYQTQHVFLVNTIPTPHVMHVPDAPPTRAMLRFVCLTLPHKFQNTRGSPRAVRHEAGNGPMPREIQAILRDHRRRISAFLSSEILDALRSVDRVTLSVLEIVAQHLNSLPSLPLATTPHHLHRQEIVVTFVDKRDGPKQFAKELECSSLLPLQKFGDLYIAVTTDEGPPSAIPLEYWLAVGLQDQSVKLTLFTPPGSDCAAVFLHVQHAVTEITKRVNQLFLLQQLHETKTCSILLSAPEDVDKEKPEKPKDKEREAILRSTWYPCQFACRLVHTIILPLHERIQPAVASRALISSALHPFSVTNRKKLFVYREKSGHVFYLRLSESGGGDTSPAVSPSPSPHSSPSPSPALYPHSFSYSSPVATRSTFIILEIYGVDAAGPEITEQLYQLLEIKLAAITLSIISSLILRNPLLKLTPEDLGFIRPPGTPPKTYFVRIPTLVMNPYLFLLFLRQNLLLFLQPLHLSPAAQYHEDLVGAVDMDSLEEIDDDKVYEIRQSDFTFIYNHVASPTTTPTFAAIGQGIACISVSLLDESKDRLIHVARRLGGHSLAVDECLSACHSKPTMTSSSEESLARRGKGSWSRLLALQLWVRGAVNVVALADKIVLSIQQTICEYVLENYLLNGSVRLEQLDAFLVPTENVLSCCRTLLSPAVTESFISFGNTGGLPSWAVDSFLVELSAVFYDSNPHVDNSIYLCNDAAASPRVHTLYQVDRAAVNTNSVTNNVGTDSMCNNSAVTLWNKQNTVFTIIGGKSISCDVGSLPVAQSSSDSGTQISPRTSLSVPPESPIPSLPEGMALYPTIKDPHYADHTQRHRLVVLTFTACQRISFYTYNWDPARVEQLNLLVSKLQTLYTMKLHLLNNILHQKMGLFYHMAPLSVASTGTSTGTGTNNNNGTGAAVKLTWESFETLLTHRDMSLASKGTENRKKASAATTAALTQPRTRARSATHTPDVNNIFRDIPHHLIPPLPIANDPVSRHALQTKALSISIEKKAASRAAAAARISSISSKLPAQHLSSSYVPSPTTQPSAATIPQLDAIAGMSRLLHFRSVPFLFADPHLPYADCKACQGGRKAMLAGFLLEYIQYLSTFGAYQLMPRERDTETKGDTSSTIKQPTGSNTRVYLQKVFLDGGMLLIRVGFRDIFVTCEMFVVPKPPRDPSAERIDNTGNTKNKIPTHPGQSAKLFAEECGGFTSLLHLNSFSYDFHLHQLYMLLSQQNSEVHPQPRTIFEITRSLHQYYPTPPAHANSHLHFMELNIPMPGASPAEVFMFMSGNAARYGLRNLPSHDDPAGDPSPETSTSTVHGSFKTYKGIYARNQAVLLLPLGETSTDVWLAVITAATEQTEGQLTVNVCVLKFSTNRFSGVKTNSSGVDSRMATPQMEDLVLGVENKITSSLHSARVHYERDMLWIRLARGNPYEAALSPSEFQTLMRLIYSRPVVEIDPALLNPVNIFALPFPTWPLILAHLAQICGDRVRQFHADPARHMLVFNPHNDGLFIHIVWNEREVEASMFVCRRHHPQDRLALIVGTEFRNEDTLEFDHVSSLVNCICQFLWKQLLKSH